MHVPSSNPRLPLLQLEWSIEVTWFTVCGPFKNWPSSHPRADPQMLVRDELGRVVRVLDMVQVHVGRAQPDGREGPEKRDPSPQIHFRLTTIRKYQGFLYPVPQKISSLNSKSSSPLKRWFSSHVTGPCWRQSINEENFTRSWWLSSVEMKESQKGVQGHETATTKKNRGKLTHKQQKNPFSLWSNCEDCFQTFIYRRILENALYELVPS